MGKIKPIETFYNGHRFRSRLEARWAVFFDTLGVKYDYEPEGFQLPGGKCYLPDFKVKCWGTRGGIADKPFDLFIEVKGIMNASDEWKIRQIAEEFPILIVDRIPPHNGSHDSTKLDCYYPMDDGLLSPFNYELIDQDFFGAFPAANSIGQFYLWGDDSNYIRREDIERVEKAYDKARQARFEHGETPEGGTTNDR